MDRKMTITEMAEKYKKALEAHRAYYQRTRAERLAYQREYDARKRRAKKKGAKRGS